MTGGGLFGYLSDYLLWWGLLLSIVVHTWCFFKFFPRTRHRRSALVVGNGLIFLCLIGLAGIIGETYYRYVCMETDSFGVSLPARRWFAFHTSVNSLGCRDDEWTIEKPEGTRRIAFIGDSFTYGWGIESVADRFPNLLHARFAETSPRSVEVLNVAKPGWGTGDQLIPIEDMVTRYGVDEIVLCYVPNDIEKLIPRSPDFDPIRPPEPTLIDPDRSALLDALYRRVVLPRISTVHGYHDWLAEGYANETVWHEQQRQLHRIASVCRSHGVTLRVVLLPFIRTSGAGYRPKELHDTLRDYFEANQIPVVDLLDSIDGYDPTDLVVSPFDAHPNQQAHRLFADSIWKSFYSGTER